MALGLRVNRLKYTIVIQNKEVYEHYKNIGIVKTRQTLSDGSLWFINAYSNT